VTDITFIFETSPNAKPKEKKMGEHGILCHQVWKSGVTRPPCSGLVTHWILWINPGAARCWREAKC